MNHNIPAVYDSGVFRPLEPVNWPDGTRAEVTLVSPGGSVDQPEGWPPNYFEQTSGSFAGEQIERPPQGELARRDDW